MASYTFTCRQDPEAKPGKANQGATRHGAARSLRSSWHEGGQAGAVGHATNDSADSGTVQMTIPQRKSMSPAISMTGLNRRNLRRAGLRTARKWSFPRQTRRSSTRYVQVAISSDVFVWTEHGYCVCHMQVRHVRSKRFTSFWLHHRTDR